MTFWSEPVLNSILKPVSEVYSIIHVADPGEIGHCYGRWLTSLLQWLRDLNNVYRSRSGVYDILHWTKFRQFVVVPIVNIEIIVFAVCR